MTCPKCNEEAIIAIKFKVSNKKAYLCESCETIWFENEEIKEDTGRVFNIDENQAYTYGYERLVPQIKNVEEAPLAEERDQEILIDKSNLKGGE